ncbi:MAG TPA: hypothetical protein VFQ39_05165 [Longimicrobium sp.]|nr:hypothetical protein [Longimicrobium sp.]
MGDVYVTKKGWNRGRPRVLVVACSDGRLQENLDEFLLRHLGIQHYDRLYAPGGPGAMASSGVEYSRADGIRRECAFLVVAHRVEDVHLVFHGPAADGPEEANCADYVRKLPRASVDDIRRQQERDAAEIARDGFGWEVRPRIHAWRCEVTGAGAVQFVSLPLVPVYATSSV